MNIEQIAQETLRCALTWDRSARLIGNLTAFQIARLAAAVITFCPKCGAEPGCNIDCDVCSVIAALDAKPESEEE